MRGKDLTAFIRLIDGERSETFEAKGRVSLGGSDADVVWPGVSGDAHPAYLEKSAGGWLLDPAPESASLLHNDKSLVGPVLLAAGDVLELDNEMLVVREAGRELVLEADSADEVIAADFGTAGDENDGELIEATEFTPSERRHRGWRSMLRPVPLIVLTVFAVLASLAWFMLTARSVELFPTPQAEVIEIEGGIYVFELGGRYLLRPGEYRVHMEREGYHDLDETLIVGREPNQSFEFALRKLPGVLRLSTDPAADVAVKIDGESVGLTPLDPVTLEPGAHRITLGAERFAPYEIAIEIEGGGVEQSVEASLDPLWAEIAIDSEPAGAEVIIDGETIGVTPMTAEILEGIRELQLSLPGYKSYNEEIEVVRSQSRTLETIYLRQADGLVSLRSSPAGASIMVNGSYRGQTPSELELAPGKSYRVELSKAGFQKVTRAIKVESGASQQINVSLVPFVGEINIVVDPPDAEVLVNERVQTERRLTLPAVPQQIEVRKPGFAPYRITVTPRPGFPQEIAARLKTEAQARADARPRRIRTAGGQELILVSSGRLSMGSSRREQGRRSNESLRQVELVRPFYFGLQEVTNAQFREFAAQHNSGSFEGVDLNRPDHPVANVTWQQAAAYCNWLSNRDGLPAAYIERGGVLVAAEPMNNGYRLPTEAEWAWAGRHVAGRASGRFPWGDDWPPPPRPKTGNYADETARRLFNDFIEGYNDGFAGSAPVGSFSASPIGLFDMGGNVAEWIHDLYTTYPAAGAKLERDPMGPLDGKFHVIRGSSWQHSTISELRWAYRDYGEEARPDVGFRLARYAE
jgi:formylglycine-generating enzyme required for sulfatase activity